MTFEKTMEVREKINLSKTRAFFEVHFRNEKVDQFSGPLDAIRLARDISTRFGNAGEPVTVMFRGRVTVEFINGCTGSRDDLNSYFYGD